VSRSAPLCIPPGSLNGVPALAGVKAGMSHLCLVAGNKHCDPIWHVSSHNVAMLHCELLYPYTLLYLLFVRLAFPSSEVHNLWPVQKYTTG